jgi:GNAT superfamily N-acetyltransferase
MDYEILKHPDEVQKYVSQVSSIADDNKRSFGFLANSAYEQMAAKGQLWVVVNGGKEIKGYLMFGGTMPTIKVFQIYVCQSTRGDRVGSKLIDALKCFAEESGYHTISARVATDLPANSFWDKQKFETISQVDGGGSGNTKRRINVRCFSIEGNDLFGGLSHYKSELVPSSPILSKPFYAIDLNLLLDITKGRAGCREITDLMSLSFQGDFTLCATPELKKELARQASQFQDDPAMRLAAMLPELKSKDDVKKIANTLKEIVFPSRKSSRKSAQNDESDVMHLAYCISAGINGFVTREKAMLRAFYTIKDKYDVAILSPDELLLDGNETLSIPKLRNEEVSFYESEDSKELRSFLDQFSVASQVLSDIFNASPVRGDKNIYEAKTNDGTLFGFYFFQKPLKSTGMAQALLCVDESCNKSVVVIDHFLEQALRYKADYIYRLNIYIGKKQPITEETLRKKGFFKTNDHYVKIICNLFLDNKNWPRFKTDIKNLLGFSVQNKLPSKKELIHTGIHFKSDFGADKVLSWFDFETVISPRFIVNADRGCILVPIQENYAIGLIGNVKNQLSLLSMHDKTLLLEKAYFRSKNKSSIFRKGGIVAFYVSGSKSIQEIIGFSRITYSDVITVDEAFIKLDRQGILTKEELRSVADKDNKLHAFTFDNFFEFDKRISFSRAKKLGLISNANLVSPEKINTEKLKVLIKEAFHE